MKVVTLSTLFFLLLSAITLGQKEYFIPKALPTPVHNSPNQLHLSGGLGGGVDLNVSYSLQSKISLFATTNLNYGTYARSNLFGSRYKITKNDFVLSGGLGYSYTGWLTFEVLAGIGHTRVDNNWCFDSRTQNLLHTKASYWSAISQFNLARRIENLLYGFAVRLTYNEFTEFKSWESSSTYQNLRLYDNVTLPTADPAFFVGFKVKNVYINLQGGISIPLKRQLTSYTVEYSNFDGTTYSFTESVSNILLVFGRISIQYYLNSENNNQKLKK